VNGYLPHNLVTVLLVALILVGTLLSGLALSRQVPRWHTRLLAWLITLGVTAGVERLTREEPAGLRMLALIATLLYGMKGVISLEARAEGSPPLPPARWLGFAALWPGMRPSPFAQRNPGPQPGGWELLGVREGATLCWADLSRRSGKGPPFVGQICQVRCKSLLKRDLRSFRHLLEGGC
jgi:hypothetical protein